MLKRLYHRYIRFIYTVKTFHDHAARLNRSVDVEQALYQVAAGKRGPLTPDECRKLANFLGCPPHKAPPSINHNLLVRLVYVLIRYLTG